jgi:activator of HSP90 ATPase
MPTINQTETFVNTNTQELYNLLMDSALHAAFTGDEATISPEVGGDYSAYGGYSTGKNIELVPGKRIVQTWRASDWPEDVESTCMYEFEQIGNDAIIKFTQTGVPYDQEESITQGWIDFYWEPIREYLAGKH